MKVVAIAEKSHLGECEEIDGGWIHQRSRLHHLDIQRGFGEEIQREVGMCPHISQ